MVKHRLVLSPIKEMHNFNLQNFVLNSGLDNGCLLAILDYLSANECLELCYFDENTDPDFAIFMKERVMNSKVFDLLEIVAKRNKWTILRIFETFGKSMRKLKVTIDQRLFDQFLRMLKYCTPGVLSELEINVWSRKKIEPLTFNSKLMEESRPYFHGLKKLTLCDEYAKDEISILNRLFDFYEHDMTNLETLTLIGVGLLIDWQDLIEHEQFQITELKLYHSAVNDTMPNLKKWRKKVLIFIINAFINTTSSNQLDDATIRLTTRFPKLHGFSFTAETEYNNIDRTEHKYDVFASLAQFTHLTELYFGCFYAISLHRLLRFVPNLKVLGLFCALHQPPVEARRILRSLEEVIEKRKNRSIKNDRIKVLLNLMQLNEFQVIKNVNKFIDFCIGWDD